MRKFSTFDQYITSGAILRYLRLEKQWLEKSVIRTYGMCQRDRSYHCQHRKSNKPTSLHNVHSRYLSEESFIVDRISFLSKSAINTSEAAKGRLPRLRMLGRHTSLVKCCMSQGMWWSHFDIKDIARPKQSISSVSNRFSPLNPGCKVCELAMKSET